MIHTRDSLEGKVVIVTGANSGIGFELAKTLSGEGSLVIIACRDTTKGLKAQNIINGTCEFIHLNLSSFNSIESFVEAIKRKYSKVDVLINNAGVMFPPFTKTNEMLELTFGVNYIGYYLLTNKLMPLLRNVKGSRVVNMSSIAHYRVKAIDWNNINSTLRYSKIESYALSNLFRVMFTLELERKFRQKNYETIAVSCHPGVTFTNLFRFMPKILRNPFFTNIMNATIFHTPSKATMPALMAASNSNVKGGDFVGFDTKKQYKGNPTVVQPNILAFDKLLREQLWQKSVEITGVDFE